MLETASTVRMVAGPFITVDEAREQLDPGVRLKWQ
jgi:hypothetical protein